MADKDIKLYKFSEIDAAFDSIANEDNLPAFDIIVKMKQKILAYINAGHSISWVISALQRSGLDLKSRQIRTYLARAGIDGNTVKRAHGSTKQRTRKPKVADAQAQESAVQEAGNGVGSQACAEGVQSPCSERNAVRAQDVQPASAEAVQAVSGGAGGTPAVQTPRSKKTGGRDFGTDAGETPADTVQSNVPSFGRPCAVADDNLL